MDRVGDLMRQLGFREDADDEAKKAFIRHLVRAAYPNGEVSNDELARRTYSTVPDGTQLSFDFESEVEAQSTKLLKRSS